MSVSEILMTGSRGRIGRILTEALHDEFQIHGVDLVGSHEGIHYESDISDLDELIEVFRQVGKVDCVVHLAADSRLDAEWESVLRNNIIGTRNVYECVRQSGIKKVVFASSNHVTGSYEGFPPSLHRERNPKIITVNDPIRPDSDYGASKAFGEALAREYFELHGVGSVCLRIGSVLDDDDPTKNERFMRTWLSHRDLVQLVRKAIRSDIGFGIYYGVSNNRGRFWDVSNAEKDVGYRPEDDASSLVK